MNVKLAKTAGFCFGVKRAVNMVYSYCNETNEKEAIPVYTFGPIIHNEEVTKDLESKGVRIINSLEKLSTLPRGKVIIRSHGVSENVYKRIEEAGFEVVDATCPFVKKIHKNPESCYNENDTNERKVEAKKDWNEEAKT